MFYIKVRIIQYTFPLFLRKDEKHKLTMDTLADTCVNIPV